MKKIHRLIAIILLVRLVPPDCWLVVVLDQNEHCHGWSDAQRFCFCCCCLVRAHEKVNFK
jgi:hypothetical protein